jgi:hypothetical protein
MTRRFSLPILSALVAFAVILTGASSAAQTEASPDFHTSERCVNCHGKVTTQKGESMSIAGEWSASIMANAARDPYWQGSVRREVLDHPAASTAIQTTCASCHMPLQYLADKAQNHPTAMFKQLPIHAGSISSAADGVSCTVCHQIQAAGLGTPASFTGQFTVAPPGTQPRPVFGPFDVTNPQIIQVHELTGGYAPVQSEHIRDADLCGSCHTLYTETLGADGKQLGRFPEQMTYLEWLHSDYHSKQTCQQCHMPAANSPVPVASLLAQPRDGVRHHSFVGANFFMDGIFSAHRDELGVAAQSADLAAAAASTTSFLQSQAARVTVGPAELAQNQLSFPVRVENLTGHKLPTGFPSRRAWLHVVVTAADGSVIFESGKPNPDGSIAGNANDADPARFTPHYATISKPDQVEIFEDILGDGQGKVTTALVFTTQYLKDNRILPTGFDKANAPADIAVHGKAADDPAFIAGSSTTKYAVATNSAKGPFHVAVELEYQPVGYRWAHNLAAYNAAEPQRFVKYFDQAAAHSALVLAHAETTTGASH